MKIETAEGFVKRGGTVSNETTFSMNSSQHAFEILSSGLYTDSVNAIVRELSSNAYDSHRVNGNPEKPFQIHLPTSLEPWFAIRDFGTGLSVEDVTGLYSTYFESTKTKSNDDIGGFGLGSKTPFSYTDNFQVTSYLDGTMYIFAVFVEDGFPKIAQMATKETNEHNGLEIKISTEETTRFADAVRHYTAYFNVRPNIINYHSDLFDSNYIRDVLESTLNDDDGEWVFASKISGWGGSNRIGTIYGQIPYPVNFNLIEGSISELVSAQAFRMYRQLSNEVIFNFEIGEVSVTANREELKYDDKTIHAFARKIEKLYNSFNKLVKESVENFDRNDSLLEIWKHLMDNVFPESKYFRYIDFETIDCAEFTRIAPLLQGSNTDRSYVSRRINGLDSEGKEIFKDFEFLYMRHRLDGNGDAVVISSSRLTGDSILSDHGSDFKFIIADDLKYAPAKAKQYALENYSEYSHVVLIKPADKKFVVDKEFKESVEKMRNWLFNPEFEYASQLTYTKPDRTNNPSKTRAAKLTVGATLRSNGSLSKWYTRTSDNAINFDDGGIYVYVPGGNRVYTGSKALTENVAFPLNDSSSMLATLAEICNFSKSSTDCVGTDDIVGVAASDIKAFDDHDKWENLFDVVIKELKSSSKLIVDKVNEYATIDRCFSNLMRAEGNYYSGSIGLDAIRSILNVLIEVGKDSPCDYSNTKLSEVTNKLIQSQTRLSELSKYIKYSDYSYVIKSLLPEGLSTFNKEDLRYLLDIGVDDLHTLQTAYPMMGLVDTTISEKHLQKILDYVMMCETSSSDKEQ